MITNINSTPIQNKMTLNNKPQKSNQNFGKIIFPKDIYTNLQTTAKEECIKVNDYLDKNIKNPTTSTEECILASPAVPAVNFLKKIKIFKGLLDNIKNNNGKLQGHEPTLKKDLGALANNYFFEKPDGEIGTSLEKLYDFFEVKHPEIDVKIEPLALSNSYFKPAFVVTDNPYKIDLKTESIEAITKATDESLTNVKKAQDAIVKIKDDFNTDYDAISDMEF